MPSARNASESSEPLRTSSRTDCMCGPSLASASRSASKSSAFRMGNPARTRVTNCWLKMMNFSRLSFDRFGAQREAFEFLVEIQLPQQESERCAGVFALLQTRFFDLSLIRTEKVYGFAIREKKLTGGRRIIPPHAARLAQSQHPGFRLGRASRGAVSFSKAE